MRKILTMVALALATSLSANGYVAEADVLKVNNRFRYRVNIACRADAAMRRMIAQIAAECSMDKRFRGVSVYAENDPVN